MDARDIHGSIETFFGGFDLRRHVLSRYRQVMGGEAEFITFEMLGYDTAILGVDGLRATAQVEVTIAYTGARRGRAGSVREPDGAGEVEGATYVEVEGRHTCIVTLEIVESFGDLSFDLVSLCIVGDTGDEGLAERLTLGESVRPQSREVLEERLGELLERRWSYSTWDALVHRFGAHGRGSGAEPIVWGDESGLDRALGRVHSYLTGLDEESRRVTGDTGGLRGLWRATRIETERGELDAKLVSNPDPALDWDDPEELVRAVRGRGAPGACRLGITPYRRWPREEELHYYLELRAPGRYRDLNFTRYPVHVEDCTGPEGYGEAYEASITPDVYEERRPLQGDDYFDGYRPFEVSSELDRTGRAVLSISLHSERFVYDEIRVLEPGRLRRNVEMIYGQEHIERCELDYERFAVFDER